MGNRDGAALSAVILAGGLGRRMGGGDKPLRLLGGQPILGHVVARIGPQVLRLALNANGDSARFAGFGLEVLPDPVPDRPGPLAGVLAALDWAAGPVVTVPGDTPFLPADLVVRLHAAAGNGMAVACGPDGRAHPTCALWPAEAAPVIRAALDRGDRRVREVAASLGAVEVPFGGPDPFFNINTPGDLAEAEGRLG